MVGTGLTAVYFLLLVNRSFFGRLPNEFANLPPVLWRERWPGVILAGLIVALGLQPGWLAHLSQATMAKFAEAKFVAPVAVTSLTVAHTGASKIVTANNSDDFVASPKL
jgi:NAD(P)H-quinone oxidoreductase subunit 4